MIIAGLRSLWEEPRAPGAPRRLWRDGVLVGASVVAAVLEAVLRDDLIWPLPATAVAVGIAFLLPWRRSHPLWCLLAGLGAGTTLGVASWLAGAGNVGLDSMLVVVVLVYALVRWGSGREVVLGAGVVLLAVAISAGTEAPGLTELLGGSALLAASAAAGAAVRFRTESMRRALDQIRSEERVGLARDLHDTVAHHVSAITVQAQAGRLAARTRPDEALRVLDVIEGEASRTLAEMRAMVRVLRESAPAEYAPQPGVANLVDLARRSPDPVIDVEVIGDLHGLRPQLDATVYRLAQEALTNALRHARHASRVEIRVARDAELVLLTVTDDGRAEPARQGSAGYGLQGMNERVHVLGGTLRAGPRPGGGWVVAAELPMGAIQ